MANKMKPDCLCKNKESEKISADKMCPSLYPILLRGEDWRRISSLFLMLIFFICGILYFYLRTKCILLYILREENTGGEFYLFFHQRNLIFFIGRQNVSFSVSYPLVRGEVWWRILSHFYAWSSIRS